MALALARARLRLAAFAFADHGASSATRLFASPRRFPRPAREYDVLAPAERFSVDVLLDAPASQEWSVSLPAWRWGRGPTVLLVHGWEGRGAQLGDLVAPLVAAGFSVVTFDAPAHGDAPGRRLYLADMKSAVVGVARAVGPLHAIVAHSFGALATSLAIARGLTVDRVAYLAPATLVSGAVDRFARILQLPPETAAGIARDLEHANGFSTAATLPEQLAPTIDRPLLIVHGADDDEVPLAESQRLAAAWRHAELVTLPSLGHRRILRDATAISTITSFLAGAPERVPAAALPTAGPERRPEIDAWVDAIPADRILR